MRSSRAALLGLVVLLARPAHAQEQPVAPDPPRVDPKTDGGKPDGPPTKAEPPKADPTKNDTPPKADAPKPEAPKPDAPKPDAPKPDAPAADPKGKRKSPDPSKSAPAGEPLAPGTVSRKGLFPTDLGRRWRYDMRTWLVTTTGEDGAAEETESPRAHKLEVIAVDAGKIEGRDAPALDYKLDEEPSQRAFFFLEADGSITCPRRVLGSGEHAHDFLLQPALPVLQKGDLAVGETWTWSGKIGPQVGRQRFEVVREERVKTPAGTFDTLVLRVTYTGDDDSTGVQTKWLAPGVGIVREESEVRAEQQVYRSEAVLTAITEKK